MDGRVLSEEEIKAVSEHYEWDNFDDDAQATIHDLIATIRDRDETIVELTEKLADEETLSAKALQDVHEWEREVFRLRGLCAQRNQQNTILREALEFYANKKTYELGVKISMGTSHPQHEPIKYDKGDIAREALAKIKE